MTTEAFKQQMKLLIPEAFREKTWIAGSYAAYPDLAYDVDLWVLLGPGYPGAGALKDAANEWWRLSERPGDLRHLSVENGEETEEYTDSFLEKGIVFIGSIQLRGWPKQVQVFGMPYENPRELLRDFDISTHQVAVNLATEEVVTLATTTPALLMPRVTNWATPGTTLKRMERILPRYGFSLESSPDYGILRNLNGNPLPVAA